MSWFVEGGSSIFSKGLLDLVYIVILQFKLLAVKEAKKKSKVAGNKMAGYIYVRSSGLSGRTSPTCGGGGFSLHLLSGS